LSFIDESKEKFDTIRISIPFNETYARAKQNNNQHRPSLQPKQPANKDSTRIAEHAEKEKDAVVKTPYRGK